MRVKIEEFNEPNVLKSNTAEGLIVTLNSTVDIIIYLLDIYIMHQMILLEKITLDNLEVCI